MTGPARALLVAERTALNFLQRLSGIATRTRQLSTPRPADHGPRYAQDHADLPRAGKIRRERRWRTNHRARSLRRDSHQGQSSGSPGASRRPSRARRHNPALRVEVEAQSLTQVDEALAAGAEIILADNLSTADIRETVRRARGARRLKYPVA